MPDLTLRANISELMDEPDCDEKRLLRTVRQFASINRLVARYRTILKYRVLGDMLLRPGHAYHLVDMGAGGCDIDAWLLGAAKRFGLNLRITACDLDPRIIRQARTRFGHVEGLEIQQADLLNPRSDEPVDYVFANHFLHHLSDEAIVRLFRHWMPRVRRRLVFSDLQRDRIAYLGYSILSLFYPRSFARHDGLASIRRGFSPEELAALAWKADAESAFDVHRLVPGRLVLCIDQGAASKRA